MVLKDRFLHSQHTIIHVLIYINLSCSTKPQVKTNCSQARIKFFASSLETEFLLDASVSTSPGRSTKEKRHVMNFKDKTKWFSFAMSFVWPKSYACAYAYVDAYVAHFAASFCFTFCLDICAYSFV